MQWPDSLKDGGAIRRGWVHVTDITPTILDVIGIAHPDTVNGYAARKPDGASFKPMLGRASRPHRTALRVGGQPLQRFDRPGADRSGRARPRFEA